MTRAIEDLRFKIQDLEAWVYNFPFSLFPFPFFGLELIS
jgi:hypothetical protein